MSGVEKNCFNDYFDNLERRIIYDYEKYGDSPACLGEIEDLAGIIGVTQGFGLTELESDGAGKLLETNVTIISNQDCYDKLNNIITTNENGYNFRPQIKNAVYEGITDQLLCTEGLVVEKEICTSRGCNKRKFFSVLYFLLQF